MKKRHQRGDLRTWLLLFLALVPTASVLAGAVWYWANRGEEISSYETALLPVDTTYELFVVSSELFLAEASLEFAALPNATDETIERAEQDRISALSAVQHAETVLPSLLNDLDPDRDAVREANVLSLVGNNISLAVGLLEGQIAGDPVNPQLSLITGLASGTVSGLVLPFANSGDADARYLYDAVGTTVLYHDQYANDRDLILAAPLEPANPATIETLAVQNSAVRDALWLDLRASRTFLPVRQEIEWFGTTSSPDAPLFVETVEPLRAALVATADPETADELSTRFLQIQQIDDELRADADIAYAAMKSQTDDHVAGLLQERRLMIFTAGLMALLGLALSSLTISEVRRRRRVEAAHEDAMLQLGEKVHRDPTTGVWNRRRLEHRADQMITDAPKQNETVVLAYLDLDHFKAINDVWGHSTGDKVLQTVVKRLSAFHYGDVEFELCRFGGDEFVLYAQVPETTLEWLEGLGHAVIDAVDSQMEVNGRRHEVGVSVGIATSTEDSTLDSLLLEADSSLILAKQKRGTAVVYNRNVSRTGELVHALPAALASGEVSAHIQPVVDARTGEVLHVEALARWHRPNGETVSPGVFVPLVESYGLAEKLTSTILHSVQQMLTSPEVPASLRIWVNVSPRELDVANFAERFVLLLHHLNLDPARVGLEITESAAVRDPNRLATELHRLRRVGVCVAIDDFGNGYSPLGYLRQLPVDIVKLDRSLISHIDTDRANQHLVIGIVGHVHDLGMRIVAEGVERVEEQQWLIEHNVHMVQGFLFGAPESPDEFSWSPRLPKVPTPAALLLG